MKTRLFITQTYYQVMVAVHLIYNYFEKNDVADIVVTDAFNSYETIIDNIKETNIFRCVECFETKNLNRKHGLHTILDAFKIITKKGESISQSRFYRLSNYDYDEVWYSNFDMNYYAILDGIKKLSGKKSEFFRFEEGILSYNLSFHRGVRFHFVNALRSSNVGIINPDKGYYYCFYPELLDDSNAKIGVKLPIISRDQKRMVEALKKIFDVKDEVLFFKEKYIYFASSNDIDGNYINETQLILDLAQVVGKENLLVKIHPRDNRTVFSENGIKVSKVVGIPWEVVQICADLSNNVLLSATSTSILNANVMLNDTIASFYLYPVIKGRNKWVDTQIINFLEKKLHELKKMGLGNNIKVLNALDELKRV